MRLSKMILCAVCILLIVLAGCADQSSLKWDKQSLSDEQHLVTEYEGVQYRFDAASWGRDEAERVVLDIVGFLSAFGSPEKELTISFGAKSDNSTELSFADKPTLADYLSLFSAAYSDPEDLVLANSAVAEVCAEKQLCDVEEIHTEAELSSFFSNEDTLFLLDLTLPMIEDKFVEAEDAKYARSAAASLAAYCLQEQGAEALKEMISGPVDMPEKTQLKNEWLTAIGASGQYIPVAPLKYERNFGKRSDEYPYVIVGDSYRICFSPDDVKSEGYPAFIRPFYVISPLYELDFADAREVLRGICPDEVSKVDIYTDFTKESNGINGWYDHGNDEITLFRGWGMAHETLLHEYVHFLTSSYGIGAVNEGLTDAIAVYECENRISRVQVTLDNDDAVLFLKENDLWDNETDSVDIRKVYTVSAARFFSGQADSYISVGQKQYDTIPEEIGLSDLPYYAAASFSEYLFELYGMKVVYSNSKDIVRLRDLWGKPFDEVYQNWGEWVTNKAAEYDAIEIEPAA